jgi:hypothetical protein
LFSFLILCAEERAWFRGVRGVRGFRGFRGGVRY